MTSRFHMKDFALGFALNKRLRQLGMVYSIGYLRSELENRLGMIHFL